MDETQSTAQETPVDDGKQKNSTRDKDKSAAKNSKQVWLGFDLGGTKMQSTLFDDEFKKLSSERKKTKGSDGADAVIERIIQTIKSTLESAKIDASQLAGIGIGCPGPIDVRKGIVLEAPNLSWKDVEIRKILKNEFKTDVVVTNDVDAGVFGEYTFGAGRGTDCLVGIFPGTGVGGGCVYRGSIFQGKMRSCMEIGHIAVTSGILMDGAGNAGTVEAVASRLAIASALGQAAYRGQAPYLRKKAGTTIADIRSSVIATSVQEDGGVVEQIVRQAIEHLSLAMVSMIHLLSPDMIVLGGGLVEAMPDFFLDIARKTVSKRILQSFRDTYEIRVAELGDDASVMGAAAWARRTITEQ
jgi:glucokinase